jgi:GAF domain-containing protein
LIETGVQSVGAEEGSLLVLDEETDELRFAMTVGSEEAEKNLLGQRVPLGKGITGLAASTHEVQIGAPTFKDVKQLEQRSAGPEAVIAAPMLIGDNLVGVITAVSFKKGKRFTSKDALLLARFASIAAIVVDQRRRLKLQAVAGGEEEEAKVFGERGRLENDIRACVTRLMGAMPEVSLPRLARLLAEMESMLLEKGEELAV